MAKKKTNQKSEGAPVVNEAPDKEMVVPSVPEQSEADKLGLDAAIPIQQVKRTPLAPPIQSAGNPNVANGSMNCQQCDWYGSDIELLETDQVRMSREQMALSHPDDLWCPRCKDKVIDAVKLKEDETYLWHGFNLENRLTRKLSRERQLRDIDPRGYDFTRANTKARKQLGITKRGLQR